MYLTGQGRDDTGYAMAALLVGLGVMAVMMTVALPVWRHATQREKEAELVFRGQQYARAIGLFQRKFANAAPPSINVLVDQRFLRRRYKDPMTADGEFQILYQGSQATQAPGTPTSSASPAPSGIAGRPPGVTPPAPSTPGMGGSAPGAFASGGVVGVVSKSKEQSIRLYNGRNHYNEWQFLFSQVTATPGGTPGTARPGQSGPVPGVPGMSRPGQPQPTERPPRLP